jgi:mono/diheme cytochrome c family protein
MTLRQSGKRSVKLGFTLAVSMLFPLVAVAQVPQPTQTSPLIERGKYLAIAGDCVACHTAAGGKELAGGRYIETPFGPMASPNITPDRDTGIGAWTDDQFYRAMHEGIGAQGEYLYPVFPYPWFTKVTHDDVLAIKAYLFSLPPIHAPKQPNHLMFPFDVRLGLAAWNAVFFEPGEFKPDPTKSDEYNRGAYLVEGLGHCGDCHTPKNIAEAPIKSQGFAGEPLQHWFAPNITSDVREGIGGWTDDQLIGYLKNGVAPGKAVAAGPMAETIHDSLHGMTDADLHAIVFYLKSTPPKEQFAANAPTPAALKGPHALGESTYLSYCASCHQLNGQGVKGAIPPLDGNGAVTAQGPENIIRAVVGGMMAQSSYAAMPALGADMTDQQIADVTNYIRTAWSNRAPATAGPGLVGEVRNDTHTMLAGSRPGGCPALEQPKLKAAIDDPKTGLEAALRQTDDSNLLRSIDAIVAKTKTAAPGVSQADLVNGLTVAYCPIATQAGGLENAANRQRLNRFAQIVYTRLAAGGY